MARRFTPFLVLLILAGILWTCEEPRLPFGDDQPRLVVISEFTSSRNLEVQVLRTRRVFEPDTVSLYILNAVVEIFRDSTMLEELTLDREKTTPTYTSRNLIPEPNIKYRIVVNAPGFEPVTAHSSVPSQILIDGLEVNELLRKPSPSAGKLAYSFRVTMRFNDPGEEDNYYHLNFSQQVRKLPVSGQDFPAVRIVKPVFSSLNNDEFTPARDGGLLFTDNSFNGRLFAPVFPLRFDLDADEYLGQLLVELRAVSRDYFLYQKSITQQDGPGLPIQGDAPAYNNIENGVGIFAGYNYSVDSILVIR